MNRFKLKLAKSDELVEDFFATSLWMYNAIEDDDDVEFNRLFAHMRLVRAELKSRPGDHRHLLVPLLTHENPQLRLNAIKSTLAIAPVEARSALEELASSTYVPYDFEARSTIGNLDSGFWVPD